jgi:hypothetical protein
MVCKYYIWHPVVNKLYRHNWWGREVNINGRYVKTLRKMGRFSFRWTFHVILEAGMNNGQTWGRILFSDHDRGSHRYVSSKLLCADEIIYVRNRG